MICFKCLIFSNLFLIFEPPAPLTLGGLAWPEEGVKVKMCRAFSSYLPHGLLHGLYVVWLHPLMSPLKLSSKRQWMESIPRVVGIKLKKVGMQESASTLSTQNLFFSQSASGEVCCHVTLNEVKEELK